MGFISWIFAAAVGAGFMYWLDLRQGKRGRTPLWNRVSGRTMKLSEAVTNTVRHLRHKT